MSASKGLRTGAHALAVAMGTALAVWLRTRNAGEVFVRGEVFGVDTDCYYHLRRALRTLEHFPAVPVRDPWLAWPLGALPTWSPGFDQLLALPARVMGLAHTDPAAARSLAWMPVVLGAVAVLLAWAAARALEPDDDRRTPTALASLLAMATLPTAVHVAWLGAVDHHVFEAWAPLLAFIWATARPIQSPLRWEFAGAAMLALTTYVFPGTMATHMGLAAGLALHLLAAPLPLASQHRVLGSGAVAFGAGAGLLTTLSLPWMRAHGQWFHHLQLSLVQPGLLAGAALALAVFSTVATRTDDGLLRRVTLRALHGTLRLALPAAAALLLLPTLRNEVLHGLRDWLFTRDPWMAAISECRPLFAGGSAAWFKVHGEYGWLGVASVLLAPLAVLRASRRSLLGACALGTVTAMLVALTLLQNRFGRVLVGPMAPLAALGLMELADRLAGRVRAMVWAPLALVGVWAVVDPASRAMAETHPAGRVSGLLEGAIALRAEAREPGHGAGVLTVWSSGFEALFLARRPVVVSGFGPYLSRPLYEESVRAWTDEALLWQHARRRDLGHLLVETRYLLTMGEAAQMSPFRRTDDGREVLDTNYLRRFPVAALVLGGSGHARRGVRHLEHLRPIFAGGGLIGSQQVPLPDAWAAEIVRGAVATGEAPAGTLVRATLPMTLRQRQRLWEAWTRADAQGRWRLVLPIVTSDRTDTVQTGSAYTFLRDDHPFAQATASIAEVREGMTLVVRPVAP